MKNSMVRSLVIYLILFYILSFLGFLAYGYFTFTASSFLPIFRRASISGNALTLFLRYLPAAHFCAILFASSVSPGYGLSKDDGVYTLLGRVILVLLAFTFVFTLLSETAYPSVRSNITYLERKSKLARSLIDRAEIYNKAKDFENASAMYKNYLQIDEDNQQVKDALSLTLRDVYRSDEVSKPGSADELPGPDPATGGARSEVLLDLAKEYLKKEDYYSALYYADLAMEISPNLPELNKIRREAGAGIKTPQPSKLETSSAALYQLKREGYDALFEFDNPVNAYYIYKELNKIIPEDKDVKRYLSKAETDLRDRTFFLDEGDALTGHLFYENLLFANALTDELTEIVYAKEMFFTPDSAYFQGLEVIAWDGKGRTLYRYNCPLGKLIGNQVLLTAIHREKEGRTQRPVYITSNGQRNPSEDYPRLDLRIDPQSLWYFSAQSEQPERLSIPALNRLISLLPHYGYDNTAVKIELVSRIIKPFSFFLLSLLFLYVGFKGRIQDKINPLLAILSIPVWYYALFNLQGTFSFVIQTAVTALLLTLSLWAVLALGVAVHGALMAVLLFISLRHV